MLNNLPNQNVQWLKQFLYQQGTNSTSFDIAVKYSELMDSKNIPHTFIIGDDGNYVEMSVTDELSRNKEFDIIVTDNNTTVIADGESIKIGDVFHLETINTMLDSLLNINHVAIA